MPKKNIVVVTDSSAYNPKDVVGDLPISVIPLWLLWDGKNLRDSIDIEPQGFYERLKVAKTLPTSSQPTPGEFAAFFKKEAEDADAIVCITTSSKISGTYESAVMARKQLPELDISVVDSKMSSMGLGFCVLAAAKSAVQGNPLAEVVTAAKNIRDKIQFLFLVDTLEFLHRSGRIKAAKRFFGTLLQVKPLLHFSDGLISPLTSERTMKKAVSRMLDIAETRLAGNKMAQAAVVDINCPSRGDQVAALVKERFNPLQVLRSDVSPVVGNVVGPGAFGFAFYSE